MLSLDLQAIFAHNKPSPPIGAPCFGTHPKNLLQIQSKHTPAILLAKKAIVV